MSPHWLNVSLALQFGALICALAIQWHARFAHMLQHSDHTDFKAQESHINAPQN